MVQQFSNICNVQQQGNARIHSVVLVAAAANATHSVAAGTCQADW